MLASYPFFVGAYNFSLLISDVLQFVLSEPIVEFFFKDLFIICKYTVAVFRHSKSSKLEFLSLFIQSLKVELMLARWLQHIKVLAL